ncbi:MAG: DedA family protein [Metallosphaera yellowstonensis]|uniref:Putative membrane-associated protein n=1 Tax=Metallosphaera yellowstonensis MK1 TaxID=671065 RepID=H2C903_9CREN|nr:DedA family protein [Metallosphaera yellowstonensis]EHP68629.1 putative membrane-associated protein [Metallosphaera yellowstonensis MK1]
MINVPPSYVYIFALMILEGMSLPIPSEVVMPLVGYYSTKGLIDPLVGLLVGTVGSLIGSIIDYMVALKLGVPFLRKYGWAFKLNDEKLDALNKWFSKYGLQSVFLFRFVPVFRALISFPAGLSRMNVSLFIIATFLGHLIWDSALVYIGIRFASTWETLIALIDQYLYIVAVVISIVIVAYILIKGNFLKF